MPIRLDYDWEHRKLHKSLPQRSNYAVISNVSITSDGLVTWTTDVASTSQVLYGATPMLGLMTAYDGTLTTSHSVQLTGLSSGTRYYLKVQSFHINVLSVSDLYSFVKTASFSDYTVNNLVSLTSFDATDTSIDEMARILGSLITLFGTGTYKTDGFTASNVTTLRSFSALDMSLDDFANIVGSLIESLTTTGTTSDIYSYSDITWTYAYDATDTDLTELSNVLGSVLLSLKGVGAIP